MAKHKVSVRIPKMRLSNADVAFAVVRDGEKLGELHVSKGAVVWKPRDKTYGKRVGWTELAEFVEAHGDDVKP